MVENQVWAIQEIGFRVVLFTFSIREGWESSKFKHIIGHWYCYAGLFADGAYR